MSLRSLAPAVLLCTFMTASLASAQPLGVFRWQQQPYCNVVTLAVTQVGSTYRLEGTDDQCGATRQASAIGTAFMNLNGFVGMGLTIVTNDGGNGGSPLHLDAVISLSNFSGTWRDNTGATGTFAFTPGASTGGSVRPVPRAAFLAGLSAGGGTITNVAAPVAATDAATKAYVDALTANVRAAMIGEKIWKAQVNSSGTKLGTGPFTSTTFATGNYNVIFDVTGLGLPSTFAMGTATPVFCAGAGATIGSRSTSATGGFLTAFGFQVLTTNAAGTPTNCEFELLATFPDANLPGSPIPPLENSEGQRGVRCSTEGAVTTCVTGPTPR